MPSIMRNLQVISRCFSIFRVEKLSDEELNASHQSYIYAISLRPGMTQDQLARHLCLNKSTITRGLAHLESAGYVERRPSETDKRVFLLFPTQKMLDTLPEVREITREWNSFITEELSEEEIAAFSATLEKLATRARLLTDNGEEKKKA
jgi:DNA-binding MarR family transcriptional regulator